VKTAVKSTLYRRLPSVDDLLRGPELEALAERDGRAAVTEAARAVLARLRREISSGRLDAAEVETAVTNAKRAGIEIVHGFFVVGNPDETVEDMRATFGLAARLRLDTFGFNRLCVYRGTPLWQEYVRRGLVNDAADWYKYFKCSEIDPTCLPGEVINRERAAGLRRMMLYKLVRYPVQTLRLLRRFLRYMPVRDVLHLLAKPFIGQKRGATKAEVLSRAVEHGRLKDAAARLTQVPDAVLDAVEHASRTERLRLQRQTDAV